MSNGKYGDLIKQARKQGNQKTRKPDDQIASQPDNQQARKQGNQKTRKPDDQIASQPDNQQARKQGNQKTRKPDDQIASQPETTDEVTEPEEEVNLCVKVPKSLRRHWAAESKRTGTTMTSVIIEALTQRFGLPQ